MFCMLVPYHIGICSLLQQTKCKLTPKHNLVILQRILSRLTKSHTFIPAEGNCHTHKWWYAKTRTISKINSRTRTFIVSHNFQLLLCIHILFPAQVTNAYKDMCTLMGYCSNEEYWWDHAHHCIKNSFCLVFLQSIQELLCITDLGAKKRETKIKRKNGKLLHIAHTQNPSIKNKE